VVHKAFLLLGVGLVGVAAAVGGATDVGAQSTPRSHAVLVAFSLPADSLPRVRAMDGAVEVTVEDSDGRVLSFGKLSAIANQITNGTIRCSATFDNTNEVLSPGQFVNVVVLGYKVVGEVIHKP
jgi:multidrug efflux system membrane fusion protein